MKIYCSSSDILDADSFYEIIESIAGEDLWIKCYDTVSDSYKYIKIVELSDDSVTYKHIPMWVIERRTTEGGYLTHNWLSMKSDIGYFMQSHEPEWPIDICTTDDLAGYFTEDSE